MLPLSTLLETLKPEKFERNFNATEKKSKQVNSRLKDFFLPNHYLVNMEPPILTPDAATRSTDTDALLSRVSASSLNYTTDNFSLNFLTPTQRRNTSLVKRPALINLGTHARTWSIDFIVKQFLEEGEKGSKKQILSLGAGSDARYWRMKEEFMGKGKGVDNGDEGDWNCKWVELDFIEATSSKTRTIWGKQPLKSLLGSNALLGESSSLIIDIK